MFFGNLTVAILRLIERITSLIGEVIALTRELKRVRKVLSLRQPGLVFLKVVSEESNMLQFKLALPVAGASDVTVGGTRDVVVKIGDAESIPLTVSGDTLEVVDAAFEGPDNTVVSGTLVDVDDATPANRSEPRTFEFVLNDTLAPPQPGEVGLVITGET